MTATKWLGLAPLVLFSGALSATSTAGGLGCGQSVATCDSDCALPDAPDNCATSCAAAQSSCDTDGCSADFQWYLTCIGNAGTYHAVDGLCADAAKAAKVSTTTLVPNLDGGGTSSHDGALPVDLDGGSSTSCAAATCASVCSSDGTSVEQCTAGCQATQATCSEAAEQFQSFLSCLCDIGGLTSDATQLTMCETVLLNLEAECPGLVGSSDAGITLR